jgi:hypothetical protein
MTERKLRAEITTMQPCWRGSVGEAVESSNMIDTVVNFAVTVADRAVTLVDDGLSIAPALVLVLAMLLIVPPLVAFGALLAFRTRVSGRRAAARSADDEEDGPTRAWRATPSSAVLVFDNRPTRITAGQPLVRIGRQDDNDIQIDTDTVHRYHAMVHRGEDGRYWVQDLSGRDGHGVRVDGQRIERRMLRGGETIDVGGTTLRFALGDGRRA